jgi:hypothetical protein
MRDVASFVLVFEGERSEEGADRTRSEGKGEGQRKGNGAGEGRRTFAHKSR